jgi:flagellar basal body rod protein FlgG
MMINAAMQRAFERISARADDVQRAFTPGAAPRFDDVGAPSSARLVLDPLSVAAPDGAYFVTADERGRTAYTQDGAFSLRDGKLVTASGMPVLGYAGQTHATSVVRFDGIDVALGRVKNARVEPDGAVVYDRMSIDPRTGAGQSERVVAGRLALARFPAGTRTVVTTGGVVAPSGVTPHLGTPGDGSFAPVIPMRRENSRIDFNRSLDRLEEAYVSFDALQAAHKARSSFGKTAMDLLK